MENDCVRALLIAEAANPRWVSVPLEGWSHSQAIMRQTRSHLITQVRNREAIEEHGLVHGRDFTAIDSERIAAPAIALASRLRGGGDKGWTTVAAIGALGYYHFEHLVWKQFGAAIRAGEYDVVHRITPLSPTVPSLLAGKCRKAGVPFLIGPLNGGVPWPPGFDDVRLKEREWLSYVRGAYKLLPGYRSTLRHASALMIGSGDTWKLTPRRHHEKCIYVPENAIDPARFTGHRQRRAKRPVRLAFVGRLVPYKGADMLIEAAAPLLRKGDLLLEILGDGPEMPRLQALVEQHGLQESVRLLGWVEHRALQARLLESDVFAFPSIREFGGAVVLEAMALGLMPLVVAYGGPAELVTPATGELIPIGSRASIVRGLAERLESLIRDPGRIDTKAEAGRRRAHARFTWDKKAATVVAAYRWVLGRGPKPDDPIPLPD